MTTTVTRLTGLASARARYGDKADRFAAFFMASDTLADAAVAALSRMTKADARALIDSASRAGVAADAPPAVAALFRQLEHVPLWVDRERCTRGGDVVSRAGAFGGLALFGCLARSYCSAGGNKPLVFTGALIERTAERLTQTANFVRAISQPHALDLYAAGYCATVRVRLAHTYVRRACEGSPQWRSADWGIAINQADLAATTLLFSFELVTLARQLGCVISTEEEGDLLHLWRYVGYLLGVSDELLCTSIGEATSLARLIECLDAGPDADSRILIAALFQPRAYESKFGPGRRANAARAVHQALCRVMLGDAHADFVGLPRTSVAHLIRASRPGLTAMTALAKNLPFADDLRVSLGRAYWQRLATGQG